MDDDLAKSTGHRFKAKEVLIDKAELRDQYTERPELSSDKDLCTNLRSDLNYETKTKHFHGKTRNDGKRSNKLFNRPSNINNYSNSSVFSLSNDDTFKSNSKLGNNPFSDNDFADHNFGEGESDFSSLSNWQTSMEAEIMRGKNSMSYDNNVLNQRSDPTLNQINSQFSLAKLFASNISEEEKYINFDNRGASPVIAHNYIEPEKKILGKSEEVKYKTKKSEINKLDDMLDFDDGNEEVELDTANPELLLEDLIKSNPNAKKLNAGASPDTEDEKLISGLLKVIKGLTSKISDFENTSRVNKAMLDNGVKKYCGENKQTVQNLGRILAFGKRQMNDYLNTTDEESETSDGSIDDLLIDSSKNSIKSPLREVPKPKVTNKEMSTQAEIKPSAFPFGCQTNFANASDSKIKELTELLAKQEEILKVKTAEFEIKLKEANKMDDVEDAFQAFLDQLDLNENEERIIIDGESRVWKIIRCSKSIIEDECLEEEEEEDEEEANAKEKQMKQDAAEEIKKQLRNRDRPTNPMRKLDSPVIEPAENDKDKKDNKEGILIVEDVVDEEDSHDVSEIKEDLESSIGDSKTNKNTNEIKEAINEVEAIEKSDGENEKDQERRFPVLSDEEKDQEIEESK